MMTKKFYYTLNVANTISLIFCLLHLFNKYVECIFFPLVILGIFEIFIIIKKDVVTNLKINKKIIILSTILCILFFIMLPISLCWSNLWYFSDIKFIHLILKINFVISMFVSLMVIFMLLFSYEYYDSLNLKKTRKIIMLIIIIIGIFFIGSTSTGFYDYDFPYVWQSGKPGWTNWHTFALAFLVYFSRVIFNNPYIIIILNFFYIFIFVIMR